MSTPTHRLLTARHAVATARLRRDVYLHYLASEVGDTDVLTPDQRDHLEALNTAREKACDELEAAIAEVTAARTGVAS